MTEKSKKQVFAGSGWVVYIGAWLVGLRVRTVPGLTSHPAEAGSSPGWGPLVQTLETGWDIRMRHADASPDHFLKVIDDSKRWDERRKSPRKRKAKLQNAISRPFLSRFGRIFFSVRAEFQGGSIGDGFEAIGCRLRC